MNENQGRFQRSLHYSFIGAPTRSKALYKVKNQRNYASYSESGDEYLNPEDSIEKNNSGYIKNIKTTRMSGAPTSPPKKNLRFFI